MAKTKKCLFCGKEYNYCPNCQDYSKYPAWMNIYCSEKCHEVHTAIGGYNIGTRTIENVKEILDKYEATDCSKISKDLKEKLEALNVPKKEEQKEKPKVEPKVDKEETVKKYNGGFNNMKKTNKKYDYGRRVNNGE